MQVDAQAALANQDAAMRAQLANQSTGLQTGLANQQAGMQAGLSNQSATNQQQMFAQEQKANIASKLADLSSMYGINTGNLLSSTVIC